jgi:hypothetical protein
MRIRVDDPNSSKVSLLDGIGKNLSSYFGKASQDDSKEFFFEILSGRENVVATIKKFHLDSLYKKKSIDLTIRELYKDLELGIDENGFISCGYTSEDKNLCVNLTRFVVNNANQRYIYLQKERFALNCSFLREKQKELLDSLDLYNRQLIEFYKKNNIVNLEKQIEISLFALSNYEQQFKSFEIEKKYIDLTNTKNSPESKKIEERINILRTEFEALRGKSSKTFQPRRGSLFINTDWGVEHLFFEKVLLNKIDIIKQFTGAISQELAFTESKLSRDIPVVQITQDAYMPDWKTKPKRATWALAVFVLAFVLSVSFIVFKAYMKNEIKGNEETRLMIRKILLALKI